MYSQYRNHSPDSICRLMASDLKRYEQILQPTGKAVVSGRSNPSDHLFMAECCELLDKLCPDGTYKSLKNTTWETSMSATKQIQKYDLPCRSAFLGCTKEELIDAENNIFKLDNSNNVELTAEHTTTSPVNNVKIDDVQNANTSKNQCPNVFSIFKQKSQKHLSMINDAKLDENHENARPSIANTYNKWTAYQNQSDCSQPEEVPNSQVEISFPAKPSLKRRIEVSDDEVKECPSSVKSSFQTGTEVLQHQIHVRHGGRLTNNMDSTTNSSTSLVGPVKRSLGGRRNVQSKFVPPFLQPTTSQPFS